MHLGICEQFINKKFVKSTFDVDVNRADEYKISQFLGHVHFHFSVMLFKFVVVKMKTDSQKLHF